MVPLILDVFFLRVKNFLTKFILDLIISLQGFSVIYIDRFYSCVRFTRYRKLGSNRTSLSSPGYLKETPIKETLINRVYMNYRESREYNPRSGVIDNAILLGSTLLLVK